MTDEAAESVCALSQLKDVGENNIGPSFLGDYTQYSGISLDWYAPEMCLLLII